MADLTHSRLLELLDYDPASGLLRWRVDRFPAKAGDVAGFPGKKLGYLYVGIDHKTYMAHRVIWLWMTGNWPVAEIDHIDRARANNRWANLRQSTRSQNCFHREQKIGVTGVRGVSMDRGKYRARIMKEGKAIALGHFDTVDAAKEAYAAAAKQIHGEFAYA
jgi:hypothetical protein